MARLEPKIASCWRKPGGRAILWAAPIDRGQIGSARTRFATSSRNPRLSSRQRSNRCPAPPRSRNLRARVDQSRTDPDLRATARSIAMEGPPLPPGPPPPGHFDDRGGPGGGGHKRGRSPPRGGPPFDRDDRYDGRPPPRSPQRRRFNDGGRGPGRRFPGRRGGRRDDDEPLSYDIEYVLGGKLGGLDRSDLEHTTAAAEGLVDTNRRRRSTATSATQQEQEAELKAKAKKRPGKGSPKEAARSPADDSPSRRGPGRPPGSKNKNKVNPEATELPRQMLAGEGRQQGASISKRTPLGGRMTSSRTTYTSSRAPSLGDLRPERARLGDRGPFSNRSSTSTIKYRRRCCRTYSMRPTSIGMMLGEHRHARRGSPRIRSGRLRGQHG